MPEADTPSADGAAMQADANGAAMQANASGAAMRPGAAGAALLLGHGVGATPPAALAAGTAAARHGWLDGTLSPTLLAPAGASFADAQALHAWAARAWADVAGGGDERMALATAWRAGRGRQARLGVSWAAPEAAALPAALHSLAPLWAGVWAHARRHPEARRATAGPWRLVLAEGPALTLIDGDGDRPLRHAVLDLAGDVPAWLAAAAEGAAGPIWVAGHSLAVALPPGWRPLPGLGLPSQPSARLLQALAPQRAAEPALRRAPLLGPRLATLLLATSALVLALAARPAWQARQDWQAAVARAQAREQRLIEAQRQQRTARAAAAQAQARLQQPWALRWAAAEAAQPGGGGWLRLEQRPEAATLLLAGEADGPGQALAAARRIAALPGVSAATLLRSESAAAERTRFEVGVRFGEGAP